MHVEAARTGGGWRALPARFDKLAPRERALTFIVVLALVVFAWHVLMLAPLAARRDTLLGRMPGLQGEIATLQASSAQLAAERSADPDAGRRLELATLRREAGRLEARLAELTGRLVSPRRMAMMLESVLTRETSLRLLRLSGLGAEPVPAPASVARNGSAEIARGAPAGARASVARSQAVAPADGQTGADALPAPLLYRHGLRIEFAGGYLETLAYLRALESLPSRFLWESLEFDVERYPRARVAITVYSLSLDDAWIGI